MLKHAPRLRHLAPLVLALGALCSTGCMESDEGVVLKKDGAGTIVATYKTDMARARELLEMGRMMMPPDQTDGVSIDQNDPFHPAWFRQAAKKAAGFTIDSAERKGDDKTRTTTVKATFLSLQEAAKGGAFFNAIVSLEEVVWPADTAATDGEKPEAGAEAPVKPTTTKKKNAWKLTLRPIMAAQYNGMAIQDLLASFEQMLSGMKLTRRVTVPSKILHSNVKVGDDGRSVVQTVDFKTLSTAKSLALEVVFEKVEGLKLTAFTHTPDMRSMLPRFQNPAPKEEASTPAAPTTPSTTDDTETTDEESTPKAPAGDK